MKNRTLRTLALTLALLLMALTLFACSSETAEEGFSFKTPDGVEITVGAVAEGILPKLGDHIAKDESPSCGGIEGNDCVFTYQGYRVKTTPAKSGSVICQIELTNDSLKTPEGLYIGMKAEDAKTAMSGKGELQTVGDGFSCTKGKTKLQVSVRDGAVSGISYLEA